MRFNPMFPLMEDRPQGQIIFEILDEQGADHSMVPSRLPPDFPSNLNNPAISEFELTVRCPAKNFVMGHNHDCESFLVELFEQTDNRLSSGAVEISSRFIRQDQRGLIHQGASDRHPLHLASG